MQARTKQSKQNMAQHSINANKKGDAARMTILLQALEHLYDPVLSLRSLFDAMAPGGYLFTSVPHLNHLHMGQFFFSMPTPWGLALWAEMAGFITVKVACAAAQPINRNDPNNPNDPNNLVILIIAMAVISH